MPEGDPRIVSQTLEFTGGAGYFVKPSTEGKYPGVVIIHENRGLNPHIKDVARRHAKKRIVSCLEGGYNLSALARSVEAHIRVLADV